MRTRTRIALAISALLLATAGCTSSSISAPSLTGPSTFGLGIAVQANPNILAQDGSAQSLISIQTSDSNGSPKGNVRLYVSVTQVSGTTLDRLGTLSANDIVTDASGQATVIYTPAAVSTFSSDTAVVSIVVTPNDGTSSGGRSVSIQLVPPGSSLPPTTSVPTANFTLSPSFPSTGQNVTFDASTSTASSGHSLKTYSWDFGDGNAAAGSSTTVQHAYSSTGTYTVTLTVTDDASQQAKTSQTVTVK